MPKNKKILLGLTIFFVAGTLVFAGGPPRKKLIDPGQAPKPYADGEVIVKFKKGLNLATVDSFAKSQSLKVKKHFKGLSKAKGQQYALLSSPGKADALTLVNALKKNSQVEYATPNYRRELCATPNDPRFSELWGLHNASDHDINAPAAWDTNTGSSSVIVAVIDTGFDYLHADLAANAWTNPGEIAGNNRDDDGNGYIDDVYGIDPAGTDGSAPDCDPMDGYGHGTHCAGTIGAVGNNGIGITGVNWNVRIMGLKFFDDAGGGGYDADAIECMEYAVWEKQYHGQNVVAINASWGGTGGGDYGALRDAIEMVNDAGIVFCAAAGNGGSDEIGDDNEITHHYPSDYTLPGIISVMATNSSDTRASFSNYGVVSVDLAAPGVGILSSVPSAYIPQSGDIFFDDMEGASSQLTNEGTPDSWTISEDQEGWADASFPVPSPTHFWSDSPGASYVNGTDNWIINDTSINLLGYLGQNVYIGFGAAWCIGEGDHGLVQISSDNGSNWTTIYDQVYDGYYYKWSRYYGLIPDAFKTANFRFRFRFTSDDTGTNYWGMLIDDVGIGTERTSPYESWGGTSMATPHVAGAVALLAAEFPSETVSQRKARILDNAESIGSLAGYCVTGARLDLEAAIEASAPSPDPTITVTSPDGGEIWQRSTAYNITWTSTGTVGNVEIHYSENSGSTWTLIDGNEVNDGVYSWTTPTINRTTCRVRVREIDDSPSDMSDANFTINNSGTHTVSVPSVLNGPATGSVNQNLTYVTGGSECTQSHPVQYYFDWGDSTNSGWLAVGTTMASHSWATAGTYSVRARARCSVNTAVVSADSTIFYVILYNEPTWVGITRFAACSAESMPTMEWHTSSELGAVGFNLFRRDNRTGEFQLVNADLLPALSASPQGGVYRFVDPGAFSGEPVTYRLEEIDAQGRGHSYGPFTITFGGYDQLNLADPAVRLGKEEESDVYGFQRYPREQSLYERERVESRRREQQAGSLQAAAANGRARITVKGRGLFYVTAAQIASSLGIPQSGAMALIGNRNLKLTGLGRDIAWLADAKNAGLFFYNEGKETVYSDKNIYFLQKGRGLPMQAVSGGSAGVADAQSFMDTLHFEGNQYPLLIATMDPAGDIWFWDYVVGGSAAKTFAVDVPSAASGRATLKVSLQGTTDTAASHDHHALVSMNGREIGEALWDGAKAHAFEIEFDASLLQEGGNVISVSGALDLGAPYSVFYVQSFDLSYPRYYQAVGNSLVCRGDGNSVITVGGLTELQAVVLDVTSAGSPQQLTGITVDVSGRVTFMPRNATNTYLVSGLNAALRPLAVVGDQPAKLLGVSQSADHVVIAPEEFKATAQELADYRQRKGLKAMVVTLEDIYDAFSHGVPTPYAIRDFLAFARKKWSGGKVKYAVLAGKGTCDYNDYQGHGDNLVPAVLGRTPEGLCAADRIYGDVVGRDGLPEIAIGRLPAVTNAELKAMIGKIKAYESGQGAWLDKALMIADNGDSGGDFAAGCNELAGLAVGMQAEKIYLAGSAAEARDKIIASWNAGAGLVNYCGHAGIDQLATENIFNAANAGALQNGGMLPLVTMYTCAAGRFELPGFTSLGEALLLNARGGMAGGMLPSGAAYHSDSMRLGEQFYKAVYQARAARAGEAWLAAMKNYLLLGGKSSLLNVYNWLGDPGMLLK